MHNNRPALPLTARILLSAVLLPLFTFLVACAAPVSDPTDTEAPYYTFTDAIGTEITLTHPPQTTAVLFSSFADIWLTAGGTVSVTVGESVERGFAGDTAILVDSGAGKTINTEVLLAAEPDFVICSADIEKQVQAARLLNQNGIPAACFRVESFSDYLQMLKICTDITGNPEAYRLYGTDVQADIQAQLNALPQQETAPRILFVRASSASIKAKTTADHFVAAMLSEIGAYNIADQIPALSDRLNDEVLVREDPDCIFVSIMGSEEGAHNYVAQNTVWQTLTAVQTGQCFYLPKDLFQFKPNARWGEAYRYLITLLYETDESA